LLALPAGIDSDETNFAYGKRSTDGQGVFVASGDIQNYPTIYSNY
jgi:hypothetical protein